MLQAQVEPHFLYNSLANVVSVVDGEPQTAKRMLEQLIAMLRSSAAAATATDATLREQVEHLRAYLELMTLRMGPRLRYRIDVAPGLDAARLPPLLLQPLVENAIRHGLEPAVQGGEVVVTARPAGDRLRITVEDTGIGIRESVPANDGGDGPGIAQRARSPRSTVRRCGEPHSGRARARPRHARRDRHAAARGSLT